MTQKNSTEIAHQNGDSLMSQKTNLSEAICANTFDGKIHIQWDPNVKALIYKLHTDHQWLKIHDGWEAIASTIQLSGSTMVRRVVVTRRRIQGDIVALPDQPKQLKQGQQQLSFIEVDSSRE